MTERINKIIELLPKSTTLADIGCDHGYVSLGALKSGKAKEVIFSDISKECLKKAQELLKDYVDSGVAFGVVSDGFKNLPPVDTAVIAGMGGEEIIKIISSVKILPDNFVLQPMKNVDKVRVCAVKLGYKILFDRVFFFDKKYYDYVVLTKGEDELTEDEITFGRTNIETKNEDFLSKLNEQKKLLENILKENLSEGEKENKRELLKRIEKYV